MPINLNGNIIDSADITSAGIFKTKIITDSLVSFLDAANDNSYSGTGTSWIDLSTSAANATLFNSPSYATTSGGTLTFNGTTQYATTSTTIEAATNSNLQTICGWMIGDGALFGSSASATGQFHLRLSLSAGTLTFRVSYYGGIAGESDTTTSVTSLAANNIVLVKKLAKTYDVYFNGTRVMTDVNREATVSTSFYPGLYYTGAYNGGTISSYLIYNRALERHEIAQNYQAMKGRFGL